MMRITFHKALVLALTAEAMAVTFPPPLYEYREVATTLTGPLPSASSSTTYTVTAVYLDVQPGSNTWLDVNVDRFPLHLSGCHFSVHVGLGFMTLWDDEGLWISTSGLGWIYPGSPTAYHENSKCRLYRDGGTSLSIIGTTATVTARIQLRDPYGGVKHTYLYATAPNGAGTGWQWEGDAWKVNGPPQNLFAPEVASISPSSGSATDQTFSIRVRDRNGAYTAYYTELFVVPQGRQYGTDSTESERCRVYIDTNVGKLWLEGGAPGTAVDFGNPASPPIVGARCTVYPAQSGVTPIDIQTLRIDVRISFNTSTFSGNKGLHVFAADHDLRWSWSSPAVNGNWTVGSGGATGGFILSLLPNMQHVAKGSTTSLQVTVTRASGFTGPVTLSSPNPPAGFSISFSPTAIASNQQFATMTVTAPATTAPGQVLLAVQGTDGGSRFNTTYGTVLVDEDPAPGGSPSLITEAIHDIDFGTRPWELSVAAASPRTWYAAGGHDIANGNTPYLGFWAGRWISAPISPGGLDVNVLWDGARSRFVFVYLVPSSIDPTRENVYFGYLNTANLPTEATDPDPPGNPWVVCPTPAMEHGSVAGSSSWDYPSLAIDSDGRIMIAAHAVAPGSEIGFYSILSGDLTAPCPTWHTAKLIRQTDFEGSQIGSRIVAVQNRFMAFVSRKGPTLSRLDRFEYSGNGQDGSWPTQGTPMVNLTSGAGLPGELYRQPPGNPAVFYGTNIAVAGSLTEDRWVAAYQQKNTFNSVVLTTVYICTNLGPCQRADRGTPTADQFLPSVAIDPTNSSAAFWVSYFTFPTFLSPVLNLNILHRTFAMNPPAPNQTEGEPVAFLSASVSNVGTTVPMQIDPAGWANLPATPQFVFRCQNATPCYGLGDYNIVGSASPQLAIPLSQGQARIVFVRKRQ